MLAQAFEATGDFIYRFTERFEEALAANDRFVEDVLERVKQSKGKHIRPLLVALSAKLVGGTITNKVIDAAVLVEMLHTASLIHDDVVDLSCIRRGSPTLNAVYSNHTAVLSGDYILARCFAFGLENLTEAELIEIALAGQNLTTGEMLQIEQARNKKIMTEQLYWEIIEKKTATLFATSAFLGGVVSNANSLQLETLRMLGRTIGQAFQIKDDLFDYTNDPKTGKPFGLDLLEGKATLPIIRLSAASDSNKRLELDNLLAEAPKSNEARSRLINEAYYGGFVDDCAQKVRSLAETVKTSLQIFPSSSAKSAFLLLCDFLAEREF